MQCTVPRWKSSVLPLHHTKRYLVYLDGGEGLWWNFDGQTGRRFCYEDTFMFSWSWGMQSWSNCMSIHQTFGPMQGFFPARCGPFDSYALFSKKNMARNTRKSEQCYSVYVIVYYVYLFMGHILLLLWMTQLHLKRRLTVEKRHTKGQVSQQTLPKQTIITYIEL